MEIEVGGRPFLLEALRSVKGVSDEELKGRASLDIAGNEILVPLPHVLLKAKLSNALELDQEDRQDVKHVKLLAVVLREYLIDLARAATEENERESLRIVREAVEVAKSANSKKFEEDHGIRFGEYIPLERLKNSTARLASFARNEYNKRFE
jgi:hypothetical protein